jgi:hypothetical protein
MLVGDTLGAGVHDGDDDVRAGGRTAHEALRRRDVEQALRPRVRREAENREAYRRERDGP